MCQTEKSTDEVISDLKKNTTGLNDKCNYYTPKPLLPTLVMLNVSKDVDLATFRDQLCDQNDIDPKNITHYFKLNNKIGKPTMDICMRVTPDLFQTIASRGFRLFIGLQQCFLRRRVLVDQCRKCFQFGHSAKFCSNPPTHPMCTVCGVSEEGHVCTGTPHCHNCFKVKATGDALKHKIDSFTCPFYRRRHDLLEKRTQYYPDNNSE